MPRSTPARAERAVVLGCPIDRLTMDETVARAKRMIDERRPGQQVSVNAAKLVALQRDPELREVVQSCELINADGQAIVWASRLLGDPLPERVAGIDLMGNMLALAEADRYRVYILGAREEVLEKAIEMLHTRHPALIVAGYHHGYFDDAGQDLLTNEIREAAPDMLFVAMSSPRKEYWLGEHGEALGVPFRMGVGGSIDVISGLTRRAPTVWQKTGMEWAYRLIQEPRRMWRRYLTTNAQFLLLVGRAAVARLVRAGLQPLPDRRSSDRRVADRRRMGGTPLHERRRMGRRRRTGDQRGTGAE